MIVVVDNSRMVVNDLPLAIVGKKGGGTINKEFDFDERERESYV